MLTYSYVSPRTHSSGRDRFLNRSSAPSGSFSAAASGGGAAGIGSVAGSGAAAAADASPPFVAGGAPSGDFTEPQQSHGARSQPS